MWIVQCSKVNHAMQCSEIQRKCSETHCSAEMPGLPDAKKPLTDSSDISVRAGSIVEILWQHMTNGGGIWFMAAEEDTWWQGKIHAVPSWHLLTQPQGWRKSDRSSLLASLLRRLQAQTLTDATSRIVKINPFRIFVVKFEPIMRLRCLFIFNFFIYQAR